MHEPHSPGLGEGEQVRRSILAVASIIFFIASATNTLAIGKVTVDPNTPDKAPVAAPTDSRVNPKVTYTARKQFICRILADLSAQTCVTLNAGFTDQDWQVRDRRMTILVKDLPLQDLMNSIARTMKFQWKTEGDPAKPSYRLYMDRRAVLLYEAERRRATARIAALRAQARRHLLDCITSYAGPSDADLADIKTSDPYSYALAKSGAAAGLEELFAACPEAEAALADGNSWDSDSSVLSPRAAQAALRALAGLQMIDQAGAPLEGRDAIPNTVASVTVEAANVIGDKGLLASIGVNYYENGSLQSRCFFLRDPADPRATAEGLKTIGLWEAGKDDHGKAYDEYHKRMLSVTEPEYVTASDDPREPLAKHAKDDDLDRKIDLTLETKKKYSYEDFEDLIAEKCDLNVVAETYVGEMPVGSFGALKVEAVGSLLGLLEDATESNWWKHGSVVEVRSRNWYEARQKQIPEAWLDQWRQTFRTSGILDLDDLVAMASLTSDQILDNLLADPVLTNGQGQDSGLARIMQEADALAVYGRLTYRQKTYVFTKRGLDLLAIPNSNMVLGELAEWLRADGGSLTLTGSKQPKGRAWEYRFDIDLSIGDRPPNEPLVITTPTYVEQK